MKPNIGTVVVLLLVYFFGLCTISMAPTLSGDSSSAAGVVLGFAFAVGFPALVFLVLHLTGRSPDRTGPEDDDMPHWPGRDDRPDKD